MKLDIFNILIGISTYALLSLLHDAFRRALEQFLAEEILSARGASDAETRKAFSQRIAEMKKQDREARMDLIYCFPQSKKAVLSLYAAVSWLAWPLSLFVSIRGYVTVNDQNLPTVEICNDVDVRIKTSR